MSGSARGTAPRGGFRLGWSRLSRGQRWYYGSAAVGLLALAVYLVGTAVYAISWFTHRAERTCDVTNVSSLEHTSKGRPLWTVTSSCGPLDISPQGGGISDADAARLAAELATPGTYRLTIQGYGGGEHPVTAAAPVTR
ncbi:hypothetical protein [Curtobacterium sp. MCBD17_040]|uniref:hypothetical protein n=1 Tax=Curtobacterium sp. MCBD17_040 TaxID=2175674 RepID=UPI0011B5E82F|nr:hypothetical protein [Curtobacterium sp. MCBD17_040]WIB65814.1 hypothetical protein DEI94_17010 [Curtobacterium sp. MCBD17_040]